MRPVHCAAVDLGATSGRVMLGTWADGQLALREAHRFPNAFHSAGGHDYWDLPRLWTEIKAGLRAAVALLPRGARLASVGVDTWGCDHVLVNDAGRMVFPAHAYRDARTLPGLARLQRSPTDLARIYAATGIPAAFYNTSLQLAETVASCPAVADLATRCLFLPDYFNFLLSGRMANGLAIAGTAQLLDVRRPEWSRAALDHFHIPPSWFGPPVPAGARLGPVRGQPGLEHTQVIAVPGHDTTCAYDAIPAAEDGGDILLSSGTWSLVGYESATPLLGAGALAARVANDRAGRGGYRPLVNVIGLWILERTLLGFGARPSGARAWMALVAAAARLPVPQAPLDLSGGEFAHPPSMKAVIDTQLRRRKLPRPPGLPGYVRLICHSLGHAHAEVVRRLESLSGRKFSRILMVGGGSKNRLLCQATADAAGLPVASFSLEGAAVGNIANQLIALKAVKDLAAFRSLFARQLKATIYKPL